jgi:N-acetylglutamate synthase-like GNAT family acetyltransferase
MFEFMSEIDKYRNRRIFSKVNTQDMNSIIKKELTKIADDPEKLVLDVVYKYEEILIVYRNNLDLEDKYGNFLIELKVITSQGVLKNRVRLAAKYTKREVIEILEIQVFGDNQHRGYGSVLLTALIDIALENSIKEISGWISYADEDHFDKLGYFYKKHGFSVFWIKNKTNVHKAADIIWINDRN